MSNINPALAEALSDTLKVPALRAPFLNAMIHGVCIIDKQYSLVSTVNANRVLEKVKEIIRNNYEEGRQDRSKIAIYRNKILPVFGIDERTFWRYMREIENEYKISEDKNQLRLFQ